MSTQMRSRVRGALVALTLGGLLAGLGMYANAQQAARAEGFISGIVQGSQGPEAGVWVIAETKELQTKFVKIVVTNDAGRFMLPQLPKVTYDVWVRGYGLVDSKPIKATPGQEVTLQAVAARSPREAAQIYPANYWYSLLEVPPRSEFPGTGPQGNGIGPGMQSQEQWIDNMKQGCQLCHQLGNRISREITHMRGFDSTLAAWDYRVQTGLRGAEMSNTMSRFGRERGLKMYSEWTDRIAAGEVPPAPSRPRGMERNLVVTIRDWGNETSYIHDEIATDKRNPRVNAFGPVYGVDAGHGALTVTDPIRNTSTIVRIPVRDNPADPATSRFAKEGPKPSQFYEGALWTEPADPHNPMMDAKGRVWMTSKVRGRTPSAWCREGSANKFTQYFPGGGGGRQASYYDPKTGKFALIDTCFGTHHLQFAEDENDTVYFSGGGQVVGWINTKKYDETGNDEASQGWCPQVLDTNGDGKITKPWNEPVGGGRSVNEGAGGGRNVTVDPKLDTRVNVGSYGIIASPVDDTVWIASTSFPGRLLRLDPGKNPPETCISEMYEVPLEPVNGERGFGPRGIDIDRNGVIWTAMSGSAHFGSFDRRKCKVFRGPEVVTGQQCKEGWTFYPPPGPTMKGTNVKADFYYYNWVDQFNTLGLGENIPIATGSGSDTLLALRPASREWVTMRVPYPLGFYSRGLDGRIDDPNAGWKGRGLWANYGTNFVWHTEGGKGTTSKIVQFQIRPDPLAR